MKVGAAVARLDGSGDVVPQILPGGQAYVDDGVVGQVGGQDDGIDDRVTQRDGSGAQAWAEGPVVGVEQGLIGWDWMVRSPARRRPVGARRLRPGHGMRPPRSRP